DVVVMDINEDHASATLAEIQEAGGSGSALICNVAQSEDVAAQVKTLSKLDILVNSAGISHIGRADNTPEADFDRIYLVNVKGVFNSIQAALPLLRKNGGVILNLASVAGSVGLAD